MKCVDFSILEEDAIQLINTFCKIALDFDVELSKDWAVKMHTTLLKQYKRGW